MSYTDTDWLDAIAATDLAAVARTLPTARPLTGAARVERWTATERLRVAARLTLAFATCRDRYVMRGECSAMACSAPIWEDEWDRTRPLCARHAARRDKRGYDAMARSYDFTLREIGAVESGSKLEQRIRDAGSNAKRRKARGSRA